jgi:hypothetical protein
LAPPLDERSGIDSKGCLATTAFRLKNSFTREREQRLIRPVGAHCNIRARPEHKLAVERPGPASTSFAM